MRRSKMEFVCLDCEQEFDEPRMITETHGLESPPYEYLYVCPHCLSSDYGYAKYCDCCEDVILGEYIYVEDLHKIICEECYDVHNMR